MAFNEDSSASGHDEPWIQWFCGLKGHEMFCEVERSYIEDGFNLYGLRACVSNFSDCLDLILDRIGPDDSDDSHLTQSACTLYGLIHARYIITAHGLDAMYNKYAAKDFGTCPLVQCGGQPVLPVGLKDEMGADMVKIFCPKCTQVYHPPPVRSRAGTSSGVDGAAFGTTFPHLFLMTFSNLVPDPLPVESTYVPRVFGFRVHKTAKNQQQDQQQENATMVAVIPAGTSASADKGGVLEVGAPSQQATIQQGTALAAGDQPPSQQQNQSLPAGQSRVVGANAQSKSASAAAGGVQGDNKIRSLTTTSTTNTNAGGQTQQLVYKQQQMPDVLSRGDVDNGGRDEKQRARSGGNSSAGSNNKRKKDSASGSSSKKGEGPTFLMESNVKRRRRNNSS